MKKLNNKQTDNPELYYRIQDAESLESEKKYLHAIQVYNSLIERFPSNLEPYFGLARVYDNLDKKESAINLLNSLLDEEPNNRDLRMQLGQFLFNSKKWNETIEVLSYFLPSDEPMASFFIGYSYFILMEYELSKVSFENFVNSDLKSEFIPDALVYLAKLNINLKNFKDALVYLKKAEYFYKNFYEVHLLYAIIYYNLEMDTHASAEIEKALSLNKENLISYEWAGRINIRLKNYAKAEKYFQKFIKGNDNAPAEIYINLALACIQNNKFDEALVHLKKALEIEPQNEAARLSYESLEKFRKTEKK